MFLECEFDLVFSGFSFLDDPAIVCSRFLILTSYILYPIFLTGLSDYVSYCAIGVIYSANQNAKLKIANLGSDVGYVQPIWCTISAVLRKV